MSMYLRISLKSQSHENTTITDQDCFHHASTEDYTVIASVHQWRYKNNVFEYGEGLDCRGLKLTLNRDIILLAADWLGSVPVYYCTQSKTVSTDWRDLLDNSHEIDVLGLSLLLRFGYIPTNRTLFTSIKRLIAGEVLKITKHEICLSVDPHLLSCTYTPQQVFPSSIVDDVSSLINDKFQSDKCIIPLSSGYDSRFLLLCALSRISDKKITTATYKISSEKYCYESDVAKRISTYLDIEHHLVDLCASSYAHTVPISSMRSIISSTDDGAYYYKAAQILCSSLDTVTPFVLSGYLGDAFSGKHLLTETIAPETCLIDSNIYFSQQAFSSYGTKVLESALSEYITLLHLRQSMGTINLVEKCRAKAGPALSHLYLGFENIGAIVSTPLCTKDIALKMINLKSELRENRSWQKHFFIHNKLFHGFTRNSISSVNDAAIANYAVNLENTLYQYKQNLLQTRYHSRSTLTRVYPQFAIQEHISKLLAYEVELPWAIVFVIRLISQDILPMPVIARRLVYKLFIPLLAQKNLLTRISNYLN